MQRVFNGKEEQSDLRREIEALGEKLKRSRDDLDKSRVDVSLHSLSFLRLRLLC